jgi:glutathione S-transferase
MNRALDVGTSIGATLARLGAGAAVGKLGKRPERPLELWEFEGCPYCRKVREALSILDLPVRVYPCPKRGERFRPALVARGGQAQFPYLADPNTGVEMYESDAINAYLFETYGTGLAPRLLRLGPINDLSAFAAGAWRPFQGVRRIASRAPEQPLELYSFEASPYCRIVRELLCSMELAYLLHNVAKGSPGRAAFEARVGKVQVPYLFDPNTGAGMFESADINRHLVETYGA